MIRILPYCLSIALFLCLSYTVSAQTEAALTVDSRIYDHYSQLEVNLMIEHTPEKIRKLNYHFQDSWYVEDEENCASCPVIDMDKVDIMKYDNARQPSRENRIKLTAPGHHIVLKSWHEVRQAYKALK